MSSNTETKNIHLNRWKARLSVCLLMLVFAFLGLIIMDVHAKSYWIYSRIMAVIYAVLSIALYWFLRRNQPLLTHQIWHQLLHWTSLLVALYIVTIFVNHAILTASAAGMVTLILLALTIFSAGIYTDHSFMLIGIVLACFAAGAGLFSAYLSVIMIPIILIAALFIFVIVRQDRNKEVR